MFVSLWHYLRGYVIVKVSGFGIERFMNLAVNHELNMWDIIHEDQCICFKTYISDFKAFKPYLKKARCRIKITEKEGMPFLMHRYRKRKCLMGGVLIFAAMIWMLSSFVWVVDVEGAKRISSMDIINSLEEQGYSVGKLKSSLDLRSAEAYLIRTYPDIIWTGIKFEGTRLLVQVAETVEPPEMVVESETPTDLVAKRDALITYIAVYKGMPKVKKGDIVKKGDVLVAGQMPMGVEEGVADYYADSKAKVRGKTIYSASGEMPLTKTKKNYTNDISKKYTLKIFKNSFTPYDGKIDFSPYDKQITLHQLKITKLFPLPFALEVETRVGYTPETIEVSEEEAKDLLLSKLWEEISQSVSDDVTVLNREAFFESTGNAITGTLHVTVEEEIGYEVPTTLEESPAVSSEGENAHE